MIKKVRITKEILTRENKVLRTIVSENDKEIASLKKLVDVYKAPHSHLAAFAVATERITEALAHVIGDLKKGDKR